MLCKRSKHAEGTSWNARTAVCGPSVVAIPLERTSVYDLGVGSKPSAVISGGSVSQVLPADRKFGLERRSRRGGLEREAHTSWTMGPYPALTHRQIHS